MSFELVHFRGSDKILKEKKMKRVLDETLEYIDTVLFEAPDRGKLLKQALKDLGWRENGSLEILEGRKYRFKGMKNGIAIEGNFSAYEYILDGMLRLQLAFNQGKIQTGVLLLTSLRSLNSKFGTSRELCENEIENLLHPTISIPVSVALFDLGAPRKTNEGEDLSELKRVHEQKVRSARKKDQTPDASLDKGTIADNGDQVQEKKVRSRRKKREEPAVEVAQEFDRDIPVNEQKMEGLEGLPRFSGNPL